MVSGLALCLAVAALAWIVWMIAGARRRRRADMARFMTLMSTVMSEETRQPVPPKAPRDDA